MLIFSSIDCAFGVKFKKSFPTLVMRIFLHLRYSFGIIFALPEIQPLVISLGRSIGSSQLDLSENVISPLQSFGLSTSFHVILLSPSYQLDCCLFAGPCLGYLAAFRVLFLFVRWWYNVVRCGYLFITFSWHSFYVHSDDSISSVLVARFYSLWFLFMCPPLCLAEFCFEHMILNDATRDPQDYRAPLTAVQLG